MINYVQVLAEQMARTRFRDGKWERLDEYGRWVPWPVLKLRSVRDRV